MALLALLLAATAAGPCAPLDPGSPLCLVQPERFDDALRAELRAGLAALPPKLRALRGGPLELELHDAPSAFGLGDGDAHPDWTDGHRRFHLYGFAETDERRATYRLEKLTP